jgi:hypothetical protein
LVSQFKEGLLSRQQALLHVQAQLLARTVEPIGQEEETEHHVHDDEDVSCLHGVFL